MFGNLFIYFYYLFIIYLQVVKGKRIEIFNIDHNSIILRDTICADGDTLFSLARGREKIDIINNQRRARTRDSDTHNPSIERLIHSESISTLDF